MSSAFKTSRVCEGRRGNGEQIGCWTGFKNAKWAKTFGQCLKMRSQKRKFITLFWSLSVLHSSLSTFLTRHSPGLLGCATCTAVVVVVVAVWLCRHSRDQSKSEFKWVSIGSSIRFCGLFSLLPSPSSLHESTVEEVEVKRQ